MTEIGSTGLTQLLLSWRDGDATALDKLTPIVYEKPRRLARRYMRRERANDAAAIYREAEATTASHSARDRRAEAASAS